MKTALAAVLLFFSIQAEALLFEWSGTCTFNCTGVAHAVFTVSDSYVPGTQWSCADMKPCVIQDIVYTDNTGVVKDWGGVGPIFTGDDPFGNGRFPVSAFDPGYILFGLGGSTTNAAFRSGAFDDPLGSWRVDDFIETGRLGIGGRFSPLAVPEPATLALILIPLLMTVRRYTL